MLFIKDQFTPRKTTGNLPNTELPDEEYTYDEIHDDEIPEAEEVHSDNIQSHSETEVTLETETEPVISTPSHSKKRSQVMNNLQDTGASSRKKKNERDSALKRLLQVEEEKLSHFKHRSQQDQDDDYYFALSLVPYLRKLPTHRKLFVRTKFQEILSQEYEALHRSHPPPQVVSQLSRQYTPVPTPSPTFSTSSTEYPSQQYSTQPSTSNEVSNYNRNIIHDDESNPSAQTTKSYFSDFRSDLFPM